MKKIIKITSVFLVITTLVLLLSSCFGRKYDKETDPHKYLIYELLEDNTYEVKGFKRQIVKEVTVPKVHNGIKVTSIGKNAFYRSVSFFKKLPILKLTIEEGIKKIDDKAFKDVGLLETILPESLEYLGEEAFAYNETKINYVNNLKYIGDSAFVGTKLDGELYLKNIEYGKHVFGYTNVSKVVFDDEIKIIPEAIFLDVIDLEEVVLPKGLEVIEKYAFRSTNIKSLTLINDIKVNDYAFAAIHNLTEVTFLGTNIELANHVFQNNINLNQVDFGNLVEINVNAFNGAPLNEMKISSLNNNYEIINNGKGLLKVNNSKLVLGGSEFTDFSKVTIIEQFAFSNRILGDIVIPITVKEIKKHAFYFTEIKSLEVNAQTIRESAFSYSKILSDEVKISSKLIEKKSFEHAEGFKILKVISSDALIKESAFSSINNLETVYLSGGIKVLEKAFTYNHKLTSVYYGFDNLVVGDLSVDMFFKHYDSVYANTIRYAEYHEDFKIYIPKSLYEEASIRWNTNPSKEYDKYKNTLVDYIEIIE